MEMETQNSNITGLQTASNRKEAEYDLVKSLLEASEFKTSDDNITEVEIRRNGKFLFAFHIHPISDLDARTARKKATTYMPNPNGKKLPPIEKDFNNTTFKSWLVYLATTPEDQEKIWGNSSIKEKYNLTERWEAVDILLTLGEKTKVIETITEISGLNEDGTQEDDMDEETFL